MRRYSLSHYKCHTFPSAKQMDFEFRLFFMPRKVELFKDRLINQLNPELDLIFLNFDPKTSTRMFFKREIPNKVTFGFLQNYKKRTQ